MTPDYPRIFRIVVLFALALILVELHKIDQHLSGEQCYEQQD